MREQRQSAPSSGGSPAAAAPSAETAAGPAPANGTSNSAVIDSSGADAGSICLLGGEELISQRDSTGNTGGVVVCASLFCLQ